MHTAECIIDHKQYKEKDKNMPKYVVTIDRESETIEVEADSPAEAGVFGYKKYNELFVRICDSWVAEVNEVEV